MWIFFVAMELCVDKWQVDRDTWWGLMGRHVRWGATDPAASAGRPSVGILPNMSQYIVNLYYYEVALTTC